MREISVNELDTSTLFDKIGNKWLLIGASDKGGKTNFMTASWGGMGVNSYMIVYANDTKVMYYIDAYSIAGGMTPLYNADGTLQIYDGE
jgi:hypothetical protein